MQTSTHGNGTHYQATIPDTLDLAGRAALSINALTATADPEANWATYLCANLLVHPPYMNHKEGGPCHFKPVEALPLLRLASGSTHNLDVEQGMLDYLVNDIGKDGIVWLKTEGRPWYAENDYQPPGGFTFLRTQGRTMLALCERYRLDRDPGWLDILKRMAGAVKRIADHDGDSAHFPHGFYYPSGWKMEPEPSNPTYWSWGQGWRVMAMADCARGLSRWSVLSGDEESLDLAGKLSQHLRGVAPTCSPGMIVPAEHGHWSGHFHAAAISLMALAEYANASDNTRLKRWVADAYEYGRNYGLSRIGWFPAVAGDRSTYPEGSQPMEGCDLADMIHLAITLTDGGVGDYWEDVDQYVRNHLVELQLLRRDLLEEIAQAGPSHQATPMIQTDDRVIERNIGAFAGASDPTILYPNWTMCCNANLAIALGFAWEVIVRGSGEVAQVNLLLNRASPWVDVDSYLPYEGKVVLKVKQARRLMVRVPVWVRKRALRCLLQPASAAGIGGIGGLLGQAAPPEPLGKDITPVWLGNYLLVDGLAAGDVLTVEFPVVETTEHWTAATYNSYSCRFKGNTLVDISPRAELPAIKSMQQDDTMVTEIKKGYPLYQREHYKANKAAMKEVTRYVASLR